MSARPRRRKRTPAARLRPFWILLVLLVLAAVAFGYYAATWSGFYPSDVSVSGNRTVTTQSILQRAEIAPRQNIWLQDMRAAALRVNEIPDIREVSIRRALPARVSIVVRERIPYARVRLGATFVVIDRDLRVLDGGLPDEDLPLFIVTGERSAKPGVFLRGESLRRLRDDYAELLAAHVAAQTLQYDRFGDLVAVTHTGVRLLLGDDGDLGRKAPLVDPILSQIAATGRKASALDLRAPKTPVVVYGAK